MDPALQEQLLPELDPEEEIEALLRLKDAAVVPAKVRVVTQFGDVVTCRIRRSDVLEVYHGGQIISLKASRFLAGDKYEVEVLGESDVSEITNSHELEAVHRTATGRGVVIGIIDWGADFAHADFVNPDGTTRFLAIWNQADETSMHPSPQPFGYGRVFNRAAINTALATSTPYRTLGYHPGTYTPRGASHGTHVAGIAAGNGRSGVRGIAPEADLIFVHLASKDVTPIMNLGDSVRLLEAIDFIQKTAGNRPLVINVSVGRHGGSHDGLSLVEMGMDNFLSNRFNTAICQSTGNYFEADTHSSGVVLPGRSTVFSFLIDEADVTPNELEIWYSGRDIFDFILTQRDSNQSFTCPIQQNTSIRSNGSVVGRIYHRANEPNNGKNHINLFLYNNAPKGNWKIELVGKKVVDGRYHAWIERDSGCKKCQSKFDKKQVNTFYTTGTICNGFHTIVVGAVNTSRSEVAPFSSSGPTTDGRIKPNILAPGMRILAARSSAKNDERGGSRLVRMSGTSMAAPHVTGTVALLLQASNEPLHSSDLRTILLQNAKPFQKPDINPQRIGSGTLDIPQTLHFMDQFNKTISMQTPAESIFLEQAPAVARISFGRIFLRPTDTTGFALRSKRPAADRTFPDLDEALTYALARRSLSFAIIGNLHSGTSFEVYELDITICLLTPLVIRTQWNVPNVCALVIAPLTTYMPASMVNIGDRWIQIPRLGEFYAYPATFQQNQANSWRRLLRTQLPQIRIPGVTVNETWLNSRSIPVLRLLIANFAAILYSITNIRRQGVETGVVMNGTTIPIFKIPLTEPDYAISVISRSEGKLESINAWDNMAGISIGPIQINTIDGHLHRFLWDVWEQDRALFNDVFGTNLQWTMRSANGRVFLSVLDAHQNRVEIADNNYLNACGYFMAGDPTQNCNRSQPVRDLPFRRLITERFRRLLVWPHIQELVMEASNRYLVGGLNILHSNASGIIPLNATNPDQDSFILKALLLSAHVRFSAYTRRMVTYLQQYANVGDKLAHLTQALANGVPNAADRQELDRRLQNQRPIAQETFQLVQARLAQLRTAIATPTAAPPPATPLVPTTDAFSFSENDFFSTKSDTLFGEEDLDFYEMEETHPSDCNCPHCAASDGEWYDNQEDFGEAVFQTATPHQYALAPNIRAQFDCDPPQPYLHLVTQFPNIVTNSDVVIEQAFVARGLTAREIARFRANGGFAPLLPIAQHFGDAFGELLAQMRYPNSWILDPKVTRGNADVQRGSTVPYLASRLLLAIPSFFRELARRTTNSFEAYSLENLGWLLMYHLRDLINQSTNSNWWLPPQPNFVQAFPSSQGLFAGLRSLFTINPLILNYVRALNLESTDPNAAQLFFSNQQTWLNGLPGQFWQAETGQLPGETAGLLFYPNLVNIPAAVNTQRQEQQVDQAWQAYLVAVDARPVPAGQTRQQFMTQTLISGNDGIPRGINHLFSMASLGNVRLAYHYPRLENSRNGDRIRQELRVLTVLVPVVEAVFRTIGELGWNDLLFHTMGGQLFRGIKSTPQRRNETDAAYQQRRYDTARRISDHAYGKALDLNYIENPHTPNAAAAMSLRLVALFRAFGFYWGYCFGNANRDGHHFEYRATPYVAPTIPTTIPIVSPALTDGAFSYPEEESSNCECQHQSAEIDEWYPNRYNEILDTNQEASDCVPIEDFAEAIPSSQLTWASATPEQLTFMRRVYDICVAQSSRNGTFVNDLLASQLRTIENGKTARTDAAQAAINLFAAARASIQANNSEIRIGTSSGYRSASRQFQLWQSNFPGYYRETQTRRQSRSGGEHGEAAATFLASFIRGILATPGFSNHNNGLAIDLFTTENGRTLTADRSHIDAWRQSWFWGWLTTNANRFGYYQNTQINEPWHWEYRGTATSIVTPESSEAESVPAKLEEAAYFNTYEFHDIDEWGTVAHFLEERDSADNWVETKVLRGAPSASLTLTPLISPTIWTELEGLSLVKSKSASSSIAGSPDYEFKIKARIYYPRGNRAETLAGNKRYPVAIIVHGQHAISAGGVEIKNHLGYEYLQIELAKRGIVSMSISTNPANSLDSLIRTRSEFVIANLQILKRLNTTAGRFKDRLDLNKVGLVGHSRGGDAVIKAATLLRGSSDFKIKAVCAIAPTDFTGRANSADRLNLRSSDDLLLQIIYGSLDGDVSFIDGLLSSPDDNSVGTGCRHYDRANCNKSMVFVRGCTHNRFNTNWNDINTPALSYGDWGHVRVNHPDCLTSPIGSSCPTSDPSLRSAKEHQQLTKEYIGGFLRFTLNGESSRKDLLTGLIVPTGNYSVSIQWSLGDKLIVEDFNNSTHNVLGGRSIYHTGTNRFNFEQTGTSLPLILHQTRCLRFTSSGARFRTEIPNANRDFRNFNLLNLRVANEFTATTSQTAIDAESFSDFIVEIEYGKPDGGTAKEALSSGNIDKRGVRARNKPFFHEVFFGAVENVTKLVFDTISIRLSSFTIVNWRDIKAIELKSDTNLTKKLFIDSIELIKS